MINLIQWNANGFYSHLAEIQTIIAQTQADYLCIQEIRIQTTKSPFYNISGRQIY